MNPKSWSRLLLYQSLKKPRKPKIPQFSRKILTFPNFPSTQTPSFFHFSKAYFSTSASASFNVVKDLLVELEREKQKEREARKRLGLDTKDIDAEDEEDYLGVGPLIEKLEKKILKDVGQPEIYEYEPTDSDSDDDDDDAEKRQRAFQKKLKGHEELLKKFVGAETLDEAFKWMEKVDNYEQKHLRILPEHRVMGDLINRLKVAEGKDKFILQQKLNRAMRLLKWKEAYDPNNPANFGVIDAGWRPNNRAVKHAGFGKQHKKGQHEDDGDEEEFDDMKERDDILLQKLNEIDKLLEEKLADLDHTFGKKGKVLEQEIKNLAEERNSLTEKKRTPMYRKGFDVKVIDVNRTCKATKGGRVVKFTAILACGNYNGVVGFAKAKGPKVPVAMRKDCHEVYLFYLNIDTLGCVRESLSIRQDNENLDKLSEGAHEKCFQNLHYVERHEEHTVAHAVKTEYKKTKVYLWPASTSSGMKAGKTVKAILNLAGFKNVKSKVIGSRNPHNTVKALFKALNAIETPKDVQEKFGRTVVEKYLL
ncbi:unnamed protein product [Dovyalis caffra]|uniref:S5 DRBM domain-containing protein n=1 Tax=Dovyalis caffra TaxID=77055 RepID=A0AAV1REL3_9ROSI|nr:unnamed protein product [Dovyalis caffra]